LDQLLANYLALQENNVEANNKRINLLKQRQPILNFACQSLTHLLNWKSRV